MVSFYDAERILRTTMDQKLVDNDSLAVVNFPCKFLVPWMTDLLRQEHRKLLWHEVEDRTAKNEWESLGIDSSFCCLLPLMAAPIRSGHTAFFVEDAEAAGNGALLCQRLGMRGAFFSELAKENWYMAAFSPEGTHSEWIRPEQLAMPSFGYENEKVGDTRLASISFGSFLLRAAGRTESLLGGADKARHVLYHRK